MKVRAVKSRCRGATGEPAFARLGSVVLVELGTHQPTSFRLVMKIALILTSP